MKRTAIIVAGGSGRRAGAGVPKQFRLLAGRPVLMHGIDTLHLSGAWRMVVVLHPDYLTEWSDRLAQLPYKVTAVAGGASRAESVLNAMREIERQGYEPDELIAIHDGARPLLPLDVAEAGWEAAREHGAAIPAIPATDSLRLMHPDGRSEAVDRSLYRCVQTPQVFRADLLMKAYSRPDLSGFTDDASVVEADGIPVAIFAGDPHNMKITNPGDLEMAETLLRMRQ